jgi:hypothetical protein
MDYSFIRKNFDINSISKSILSIQVSLDGFSFVITPAENQEIPDYVYIKRIKEHDYSNLTESLSTYTGFDLKEFYAIRIIVHELIFALVPDTFFDLRDMKTYLSLNHPPRIKCKALSNRIVSAGAACVFSMDLGLYELLRKKFPGADFCHTSLPFCKMALKTISDGCFIQCYEKSIELALVKNQKLVLYNIFGYQNGNDIVYFVLNAYKSFHFDPLIHPLYIAGVLTENSEAVSLAGKYIKDIRFYSNETYVIPENSEFQYLSHYFLNHREILNCEL